MRVHVRRQRSLEHGGAVRQRELRAVFAVADQPGAGAGHAAAAQHADESVDERPPDRDAGRVAAAEDHLRRQQGGRGGQRRHARRSDDDGAVPGAQRAAAAEPFFAQRPAVGVADLQRTPRRRARRLGRTHGRPAGRVQSVPELHLRLGVGHRRLPVGAVGRADADRQQRWSGNHRVWPGRRCTARAPDRLQPAD